MQSGSTVFFRVSLVCSLESTPSAANPPASSLETTARPLTSLESTLASGLYFRNRPTGRVSRASLIVQNLLTVLTPNDSSRSPRGQTVKSYCSTFPPHWRKATRSGGRPIGKFRIPAGLQLPRLPWPSELSWVTRLGRILLYRSQKLDTPTLRRSKSRCAYVSWQSQCWLCWIAMNEGPDI